MNKREEIIEKFKVLLASIFPVEVEAPVIEAEVETAVVEVEAEVEVKLAEATLEDGTIVSYESLELGQVVNVVAEDGTVSPLPDGEYTINDVEIYIVNGVISEKEVETPEVIVEQAMMSDEEVNALVESKLAEVKLAYEAKLTAQKAEFDAQVEELGNKVKAPAVIQAPVEVATKPLTYKERLSVELSEKRKENKY